MAFTFKTLKGLGLEEDKIDIIMEAHNEVVKSLKEDKDRYKGEAEEVETLREELKKANETIKALGDNDYQQKYEKEKEDFEAFKRDIQLKEEAAAKRSAYKALLKEAGVIDGKLDSVLKVCDLENIELKDGKIEKADELLESIKTEWKDFIVQTSTTGANTSTPPGNESHKMTKEEIMKIKDATQRQKAIADNLDLFGYHN